MTEERTAGESTGVRVERFIVGWFTAPAGLFQAGEPMDRTVRYPVPAYLLETGRERILVDTGLDPAAIADPGSHYGRPEVFAAFGLEQERSIAEQVDLASLTRVVATHLHWDHVGGLGLVPTAVPLVVQRREWEGGHDDEVVARNHLQPRDYADQGREVVLLDGDADLLGDGSVELLSTPGHTRGHQSVRVGDVVIGADVTHFASGLDDHRFPLFADDHEAQRRSAERLRSLRDGGATVIPGHDPELLVPGTVSVRG